LSILFLGEDDSPILAFLRRKHKSVVSRSGKITSSFISSFDLVISYGYKHILPKEVIDSSNHGVINLHISMLPWNRGAHPNFWSFVDGTPKGVSIHFVDEGIDTGDIILQKEVYFEPEDNTFKKTYCKLKREIEELLVSNWNNIITGNFTRVRQNSTEGSFHEVKDLKKYSLSEGWGTKTNTIISSNNPMNDLKLIDEIESVRSKNNCNWMDVLRLAIKHSPKEAKEILRKINSDDGKISELLDKLSKD